MSELKQTHVNFDQVMIDATLGRVKNYTSANKPTPASFRTGPIWIDGVQYWSDGASFTRKGVPDFGGKGVLIIGGDHPNAQWWGNNGKDGMAAMYLDRGIKPYIAVNTDTVNPPGIGIGTLMPYSQLNALQNDGVEMASHGHHHIQSWEGITTGIELRYVGTGTTATVAITATNITGLVNASAADPDSFDIVLANTANNTIAKVVTAINTLTNWTCTYSDELLGTENSSNLLMVNAQDAKTAVLRLAASGGLWFKYNSEVGIYKRVFIIITSTYFIISVDGGDILSAALLGKTLTTLKSQIDALNISGLTVSLCNNNGFANFNYLSGNELAENFKSNPLFDVALMPHRANMGLSREYIIDRQMDKAVELAKIQGIDLKEFIQSGGDFFRMHYNKNHHVYRGIHTKTQNRPVPQTSVSINAKPLYYHFDTLEFANDAQYSSAIRALAASPGHFCCFLTHAVTPDGTSGYNIPVLTGNPTIGATENGLNTALIAAKDEISKGNLVSITPSELGKYKHTMPMPDNYIFNPQFINSGESLTSIAAHDNGKIVSGWTFEKNANISYREVINEEVVCTTASASQANLVSQKLHVELGSVYEYGIEIDVDSISAGSGVFIKLAMDSHWDGAKRGVQSFSSSLVNGNNLLRGAVQFPAMPSPNAEVISKVAGPFNLSTNTDIKINFDFLGQININIAAGAVLNTAVTSLEVADNINAALRASSVYGMAYANAASVDSGFLVIRNPYKSPAMSAPGVLINNGANNATGILFHNAYSNYGYALGVGAENTGIDQINFIVISAMAGTVKLRRPYFTKLRQL